MGLGYLLESATLAEPPAPKEGGVASSAQHDDVDVGDYIDSYIAKTRTRFEAAFVDVPRTQCTGCGRRKRWFCAHCAAWLSPTLRPAPLRLPFRVVVMVRDDVDSATGIHAAALASPVTVQRFQDTLLGEASASAFDPATTFVLYPSASACTVEKLFDVDTDLLHHRPHVEGVCDPRCTIVVPDTKWNNDGAVLNHPSLRGLRRLKLRRPPAHSRIWRSNHRAVPGCVSTIEALFVLLQEFESEQCRRAEASSPAASTGGADDDGCSGAEDVAPRRSAYEQLLLLFSMTHHLITTQTASGEAAPYDQLRKLSAQQHRSEAASGIANGDANHRAAGCGSVRSVSPALG